MEEAGVMIEIKVVGTTHTELNLKLIRNIIPCLINRHYLLSNSLVWDNYKDDERTFDCFNITYIVFLWKPFLAC